MKTYIAKLKSVSPYSQSKFHETPKQDREIPKDYEERTWKQRLHTNGNGTVVVPPMAIKNCLSECAKYMGIQIPGKGKSNYTKHFEAGILITDPVDTGVKVENVKPEWLFLPSDGKRGGGKRVPKCYPLIEKWEGEVTIVVLDDIITEEVLTEHLVRGGQFIGIGRFRPRNNGYYGRFELVELVSV
jgi:hypothetical protein